MSDYKVVVSNIDLTKFIIVNMLRDSKEIEVSLDYGDFEGIKEYHNVKFTHSSADGWFRMLVDGEPVLTFGDFDLEEFKELVNSLWY